MILRWSRPRGREEGESSTMKCGHVGRTAIRRMRPSCVIRAVEAERRSYPRQESAVCGELPLPTSSAKLSIVLVLIPEEAA